MLAPVTVAQQGPQYRELRKMTADNPHLGETERRNLLAKLQAEMLNGGGPLTQALTTMKTQNLDLCTVARFLKPAGSSPTPLSVMMEAKLQQAQSVLDSPGWKALSPEQRQKTGTYLAQLKPWHTAWMLGELDTLL